MLWDWLSSGVTTEEDLNVREAFNLWDVLKSKYDAIEKLELWEQFVHDQDLKLILQTFAKSFKKNVKTLENLLKEHSIRGPEKGRAASNWPENQEPFRDEMIALDTLFYMQEHIENMLQTSRTTITNDRIRKIISKMLIKTIKEINPLYKYLKLKGWLDNPPLYSNTPENVEEKISCAEAAHLWDHITYRYDNKRQTLKFFNLASDQDLQMILQEGIDILQEQIKLLEIECKKFGLTLPKKPAETMGGFECNELFNDDEIYRTVLTGLQGASVVHVKSLKQCTVNDRIRNIFKDILLEEIKYYENFIKYGKLKGWLNPCPRYKK
ncbi:DUF3231 family protein [Halanaerobaculum tunisiense]